MVGEERFNWEVTEEDLEGMTPSERREWLQKIYKKGKSQVKYNAKTDGQDGIKGAEEYGTPASSHSGGGKIKRNKTEQ